MNQLFFCLLMACAIANGYFAMRSAMQGDIFWAFFSLFFTLYSLNSAFNTIEDRY